MTTSTILLTICGIGWIITYIEALRVGHRDKSYGIPFIALGLNFTWELYYTLPGYFEFGTHVSSFFNAFWLLLDCGILYMYFNYGIKEVSTKKSTFYIQAIVYLIGCMILQHFVFQWVGIVLGALYMGFLQCILMSILFIRMYYRRPGLQGQSLILAIAKFVGTLPLTILFGIIGSKRGGGVHEPILYIGSVIFILDVIYIYLVAKRLKSLKLSTPE
ncbi:hypothetical protein ACPUEN_15840 [Algoriphagus yeomjeoni]|uniref:transmembrane-type terpene cyclase n=1 Tax=Algoriphagus yeomjeoni TaxID=291403 RepID=UPI003CE488FE